MSKTGSIKKTGSTWGFVLDVGRSNGRRQQVRKRGFRTKKDAQSALNDALADLQHGSYVRPRRVTFGEYLDDWVAAAVVAGRRPSTIAGYRQRDPALHQARARRLRAATDHGGRPRSAVRAARVERAAPAVGARCRRARSARCTRADRQGAGRCRAQGSRATQRRAGRLSPVGDDRRRRPRCSAGRPNNCGRSWTSSRSTRITRRCCVSRR